MQAEPNTRARSREARESEHFLRGGRQPCGRGVPLDVQQLRRESGREQRPRHAARHVQRGIVHADDGAGLRHAAVLGDEPHRTAEDAVRLSHYCCRYAYSALHLD